MAAIIDREEQGYNMGCLALGFEFIFFNRLALCRLPNIAFAHSHRETLLGPTDRLYNSFHWRDAPLYEH